MEKNVKAPSRGRGRTSRSLPQATFQTAAPPGGLQALACASASSASSGGSVRPDTTPSGGSGAMSQMSSVTSSSAVSLCPSSSTPSVLSSTGVSVVSNCGSAGSDGSEKSPESLSAASVVTIVKSAGVPSAATTSGSGSSSSTKTLESQYKLMTYTLPGRPGFNTTGKPLAVFANYFEIKSKNEVLKVQHYRLELKHERRLMRRDELREFFWEMVLNQLKLAADPYEMVFDGGYNLFTRKKLVFPNRNVSYGEKRRMQLVRDFRDNDYSFQIQHVGFIDFNFTTNETQFESAESAFMTPVHFVDLLLHQYYALPRCIYPQNAFADGGRSFYYIPVEAADRLVLGHGAEAWRGYFASAKYCNPGRMLVNIDTSNGIFFGHKKSILQYLCEILNGAFRSQDYQVERLRSDTRLSEHERRFSEKAFKNIEVTVNHIKDSKRIYKVRGFSSNGASEMTFSKKVGETETSTSVAEYFQKTYRALQFPFLPCLIVGLKKRDIFLPMEVCDLSTPAKYTGKINEEQTSLLIRTVCVPAPMRRQLVHHIMTKATFDRDPFLNHFEIAVGNDMAIVQGRRLEAPKIIFGNNRTVDPRDGVWTMDRNRFYQGAVFEFQYALVSFVKKQRELETFCGHLSEMAGALGIRNFPVAPPIVEYAGLENFESVIKSIAARNVCFTMIILDKKDAHVYGEVKRICDVVVGMMSQCVLFKNVAQLKPTTLSNILLKLNTKMDGVNMKPQGTRALDKLLAELSSTLILGVDVSHPGPTDRRSPSIAACVGNIDAEHNQFAASVIVQRHRRESVVFLLNAIKDRIFAYYKVTKKAPRRIIVYRDGVAEGQFQEILTEELACIRAACMGMDKLFQPKVTIVVVQKRHHTRFFCAEARDECGKARNVPPGTVVDKSVASTTLFDFFLCSHFGIQGTSRPTHYHVIIDENNYSADEIQALTYHLCHQYARCTRSVSIPAPVYYAHLACTRARLHLQSALHIDDSVSTISGDADVEGSETSDEHLTQLTTVADTLQSKMYFV